MTLVVKEHRNSFQTRPKRGRRPGPQPGEKYRRLRGNIYSYSSIQLLVNNIHILDSEKDPREKDDPEVIVSVIPVVPAVDQNYVNGELVWADWNEKLHQWEAQPKAIS